MSIRRWLAAWPLDRRDVVLLAGFGSLVYGVGQVSVPSAWMTAGGLLLAGWVSPYVWGRKKGS